MALYDFLAVHWVHIRSTNVIETVFATVRLRTYKTKGDGNAQRDIGDVLPAHHGSPQRLVEAHPPAATATRPGRTCFQERRARGGATRVRSESERMPIHQD